METATQRRETSMGFWWILAFLAVWLALQLWILPKLGVST
jgi:hypothetical protein